MGYNFVSNLESCYYNIPALIYYSHIPTALVGIVLGVFVFMQTKRTPTSFFLFLFASLFAIWSAIDLVLWLSPNSSLVIYFWSIINLLQILTSLSVFYFVYLFFEEKYPPFYFNLFIFFELTLYALLIPTSLNLNHFDYTICEALQGPLTNLFYLIEGLTLLIIVVYLIKKVFTKSDSPKAHTTTFAVGALFFVLSFTGANLAASALAFLYPESPDNWKILQYGLMSMPMFMAFLTYTIVKFKIFNMKLAGAQALVVSLWFLVGSLLFVVQSNTARIVAIATLLFTSIAGYFLVRSVKREIQQREQIEQLAQDLARANDRLRELDKAKSEFVSIASHQLRSPLTSIRGYASMMVEGSFGKIPEKALEAAARIEESAKLMVLSVEDYLNVSRIESGNMKYNLSDFNVKDMVEHICDDMRPEAMKKGLIMLFRSDLKGQGNVNADIGKTNQIIQNLLNNSLKYTPKGSINVFVHDDLNKKRIYVSITDTGIGMSEATAHTLFQKFSRADNANSVNVSGTGLGLYVALKMAEQMGGTITCESEGDDKGSTFTFELPLAM